MGLFDMLDDPKKAAELSLYAGLLGGRGSFNSILGDALMNSQKTFQVARRGQQEAQLNQEQLARARRLALEEEQQQKQQALDSTLLKRGFTALPGPTETGAPLMPTFDPASMIAQGSSLGNVSSAAQLHALMSPKLELLTGKPGDVFFDKKDPTKPLFSVPEKPEKGTDDMQEFLFARSRNEVPPGQSFTEWMRANKRAGASNVSVNTGQKGYENESKLRNDFKTEPIYKDYHSMSAAHKQIKAGIAANNPVGDLATATKIMKLLDPDSVVRESELGMAMAASGRMDRLKNFVPLWVEGRKLTPTQLIEFGSLADELLKAAGDQYDKKRGEYANLADRYKLDKSVLGDPHSKSRSGSVFDQADAIISGK